MKPKQVLKRTARPFAGPLLAWLDRRARHAVVPLQVQVDTLQLQFDRTMPVILNQISSQLASDRNHARSFDELYRRTEFIRREIMFELRYATGEQPRAVPEHETRILNPAKLAEMGDDVRINLGAGHIPLDPYLNVDQRPLDGIDVVADVRDLPFEKGSLGEIYSTHVLEHFPLEELRRVLLPYWTALLKPGGRFVAVVPDMETMISECAAGRVPFEDFREVAYGSQEYEGDFHFNGFSQDLLTSILSEAGLSDVHIRQAGRRNGLCYEMEVEGRRLADGAALEGQT